MITMTGKTQSQIDTESAITTQQAIITENTTILEQTRYHVDIAFETGSTVLPEIATQRARARAVISAAQEELKTLGA